MSLTKVSYSMIDGISVNVLDYGADPTGVADSKAAIQAAIDYAYSLRDPVSLNGQPAVYLPAGRYLISDSLIAYDYTTIIGEGYRNTYIQGDLANKSIVRSQYGETPSYAQRTLGWQFKGFSVRSIVGAANTIGLNLGNVGYSDISDIGITGFSTGLRATHRVYYTRLNEITTTNCGYGMYLQSDGGGNNITNCHIGFNYIGIRILQGAWEIYGGTVDTADAGAVACIYSGVTPTDSTTTSLQIFGTYIESAGVTPPCIQFGDTTIQSSVFGITRRNVVGPIVFDAGVNTDAVTIKMGTGYADPSNRVTKTVFAASVGSGVYYALLKAPSNQQLDVRTGDDSDYADFRARSMRIYGGGLSADSVNGYMPTELRGSVTITAPATTAAVTFAAPFNFSTYFVYATPNDNKKVWITNRTNTGFTINVDSSPTVDMNVDWLIIG